MMEYNHLDRLLLLITIPFLLFLLFCIALMLCNQITFGYYAYVTIPELFGY